MKTRHLIPLLISTLFIAACKKDPPLPESPEPVMPPLTHQGLNTFGCYIDGELFVANEGPSVVSLPPLSGSFDEETKRLSIQGTRYINYETNERDNIKILSDITDGGINQFQFNEDGGTVGYRNWHGDKCDYYYREYPGLDIGKLTITYLNEEKNIISGTFYINLVNEDCEGDTLMKITDGRFDFRY